jgi:hypothetical protein
VSAGDGLARLVKALDDHGSQVRGGSARCPAHEDRNPSLSVSQGRTGALVHCHAGCDTADVLAKLGLAPADLFDEPPARRDDEAIATYTYTDERGTPLFYVQRSAGKRFHQYRVVGGQKVLGLGDARRVPYHLPRLLDAAWCGDTVYVVEGEKDVHAVEAAGAAATCNPMGAGKWRPEYARYFDGAGTVIVVADRDEPGRAHAAQVAASLREVADEVQVVEAAQGKDAYDHLVTRRLGLAGFRPLAGAPPPGPPVASLGAKKAKEAKEAKEAPPDVPVAAPEIYTGILGDITHAAAPGTEADPVGILGSLLAMAGVAVGTVPHVQVGNDRHPLLIWPLLFGSTGSGRKGGATQTGAVFARAACPDFGDYATSGLSSGEGLVERIRDSDGKDDPGVADKRLIAIETEFGTVMARAARDGSTLAEVCRQAWNGEALSVLNRKRLNASWSHVGIIGHIAPKDFRRRLAAADLAAGTYNRYLPLYVERSRRLPIPEGADLAVVNRLGGELGKKITAAKPVTRLQLDGEATALWCDELYDELTAPDDEDAAWAEFMRRAAPYCLRIAGLYAVLDGRRLIGKADLTAAGALVRYSAASARYVLATQPRDPRLARLTREITAAGETGLTRTQISALFGRNLPGAALGDLLDELTGSGSYEVIRTETSGRPVETYRRTHLPTK